MTQGFSRRKTRYQKRQAKQLIYGGSETHSCQDGSTFTCPGGTRECRDHSPVYCPSIVGGITTITCPNGTTTTCNAGTEGCFNNSQLYCSGNQPVTPPTVGFPTVIYCQDGSLVTCNTGTEGCFNNSPEYCPNTPPSNIVGAPTTIRCADGTVQICNAGTQGCFANSPLYCNRSEPDWETYKFVEGLEVSAKDGKVRISVDQNRNVQVTSRARQKYQTSSLSAVSLTYYKNGSYQYILGQIDSVNRSSDQIIIVLDPNISGNLSSDKNNFGTIDTGVISLAIKK